MDVETANLVDLSGIVFDDLDNDGLQQTGEPGLGGVALELRNEATADLVATTVSSADGMYAFDANLRAGTYQIVEVFDEWSRWLLDGPEMAGTIGGQVDNSQDWNQITAISVGEPGTTDDGTGYTFAEIQPSDISGLVWEDFNNDGEVNFGEKAIAGVSVTLTGQDDRGNPVSVTGATDADGVLMFYPLRPSAAAWYTISETQPAGYVDGKDVLGTVNGVQSRQAAMRRKNLDFGRLLTAFGRGTK